MQNGYVDFVEYLVRRKFPLWKAIRFQHWRAEQLHELQAYERELNALSFEELAARYEAEKKSELAEISSRWEREERGRFFNEARAAAQLDHWARMSGWSLDEAIALSFGKDPRVVHWKVIQPLTQVSAFARAYEARREIVMRARQWGQLYDPVLPSLFLAWARRVKIPYPAELEAAITELGQIVGDWKTAYEAAQKVNADLAEKLTDSFEERRADSAKFGEMLAAAQAQTALAIEAGKLVRQQADELRAEAESLREQLAAAVADAAKSQKPLGTKQQESLLKIVIAMAVGGYGYDPNAARSDVVSSIGDDLAKLGVPLDPDTIRSWLKRAADIVRRETPKAPDV